MPNGDPNPDLIATWHHALGFATLDAVDRRAWRALGRFDGTPRAAEWQPPAFQLVVEAEGATLPLPDVIKSGAPAPVMSAHAAEVLTPLWGSAVEWLPLAAGSGSWLAANPIEVVAALDPARSRVRRFESSGRVMAIESYVFTDAPRPPVFKDVLAPELATFVGAATLQAVANEGLTGLDAHVVWPDGALWDPTSAPLIPATSSTPPGRPADLAPGSGTAAQDGYRLTDDDTHTWIAPDRDRGAWYALRIPNGWRDVTPLADDEITLRSHGQAISVLGVQRLTESGPLSIADATALLAGRRGWRLIRPPLSDLAGGHPAVRLRAIQDIGPDGSLLVGVLVVQVGPERLVVTTATSDLTGAELDLVDDVALADLVVRWLG